MYSFRRVAFLLAMSVAALQVLQAQDLTTSSSSTPTTQEQTPAAASDQNQGEVSVQARIKARREQRRTQAIRDTYLHLYEAYVAGGYLRTTPGPGLQKVTEYAWNAAVTRYYGERLGVTVDGRGYYGTAYVGLNPSNITRPAISQYDILAGPTYRLRLRPKYSLGVRGEGGVAIGNFSGDTSGFSPQSLGLYADSTTYAVDGGIFGEANLSPNLSLRLTGEYLGTGFGSTMQNGYGFNYGIVYRFGKQ